jgi:hypothetical protein
MNANPTAPTTPESAPLVDSVVDLGLHWARYGLTMGRMAVRSQAVTLRTVATLLDEVGDVLEARAAKPPEAPPAPEAPAERQTP